MSDPSLEDDSLISQDDIDKLLDASSIEDAEAQLDAPEALSEDDADDLGELSQDDIDSLLNGSSLNGDAAEAADVAAAAADDAGELSQDDIDSLMNGSLSGEDEGGELSQDDIDSLMGGTDDPADEEDLELISQEDIDRLMNPSEDPGDDPADNPADDPADGLAGEDDDELISMDDIQGMIDGDAPEDPDVSSEEQPEEPAEAPADEAPETVNLDIEPESVEPVDLSEPDDDDPLDNAIDATEALDVSGCLLTQETMDELIAGAADTDAMTDGDEDPSQDFDLEAMEDLTEDLSEDMDQMLESDDEDFVGPDLDAADDGDVTQEDIDALLQESDDDDSLIDDEDILISQDDIDTLLMAADQEDEDVLGDDDIDGIDDVDLGDLDTEDFLDSEDEMAEASGPEQVVLEGAETGEDAAASPDGTRRDRLGRIFKSKLVLASVTAALVLGISVPVVYFLIFSQNPAPLPENERVPVAAEETFQEIEVATVTVGPEPELMDTMQSGNIILADFIILASEQSKKMTYVYADISIDYSDQRAYHEISNNSSFYRDLIYESIQASLVSERGNEVTEADLLWEVETSLKKVLPPHYIKKISFKSFRTS